MEVIKETKDYTIYQKRSKRYAVKDGNRAWLSGDAKVKVLLSEKLLDVPAPKAKEEAPAAEESAGE